MKQQVKLKVSLAIALAIIAAVASSAVAAQTPQLPLAPTLIPQFAQPLPVLSVGGGSMTTVFGNQPLTVTMCEFDSQVLPPPMPTTRVWGYIPGTACPTSIQGTYIGPLIVN
ncbi:MAG: multicopper oxidase, type 2, partial [Acidobacteria bacterium]|nr:multicopper oxidase, type 2 [Acidobacteriota bacterium]